MAYTEADLTAVRTARKRGVRTVQYADRAVTYSSDAELRQLEQDILTELHQTTRVRRKQLYGVSSKGL
jgi:hypothetical protein